MHKKSIIIFILCFFCIKGFTQISLGLRDSRYARIGYTFRKHYNFYIEQSIYSSKIKYQYFRCYLGYSTELNNFLLKGDCYWGSAYNRTYNNWGIIAKCSYQIIKPFKLNVMVNPHYDTYFKFKMCTEAGLNIQVYKDIDAIVAYSSIPEFRQSEQRLRTGLNFHVKDYLWVTPILSFPLTEQIKSFRVLVSFGYTFKN